MISFGLSGNYLHGTIPPGLTRGTILQDLDLSNNLLSGDVPSSISPTLGSLNLRRNLLHGTLPADLCAVRCNLLTLQVSDNQLRGTVPEGLFKNLRSLQTLDVSLNKMTGTIPESVQMLTRARRVSLSGNKFSGPLSGLLSLPRLATLEADENWFTGPLTFPYMPFMTVINVSGNLLAGRFTINHTTASTIMTNFDASRNHLTGPLPARLNLVHILCAALDCCKTSLAVDVKRVSVSFDMA